MRVPVLWLFTDAARLPDPLPAIARLPKGLCGVVFRQDDPALLAQVARLCRERRVALVVAGGADHRPPGSGFSPVGSAPRGAVTHAAASGLGVGVHLRGGARTGWRRHDGLVTSSAHNVIEVRRAARAGAQIIFISPAFATASHPGEPALGAVRWNFLARHCGAAFAYALGGLDGRKITALAGSCCGAAGISALA